MCRSCFAPSVFPANGFAMWEESRSQVELAITGAGTLREFTPAGISRPKRTPGAFMGKRAAHFLTSALVASAIIGAPVAAEAGGMPQMGTYGGGMGHVPPPSTCPPV